MIDARSGLIATVLLLTLSVLARAELPDSLKRAIISGDHKRVVKVCVDYRHNHEDDLSPDQLKEAWTLASEHGNSESKHYFRNRLYKHEKTAEAAKRASSHPDPRPKRSCGESVRPLAPPASVAFVAAGLSSSSAVFALPTRPCAADAANPETVDANWEALDILRRAAEQLAADEIEENQATLDRKLDLLLHWQARDRRIFHQVVNRLSPAEAERLLQREEEREAEREEARRKKRS